MKPNIGSFERLARVVIGVLLGGLAVVAFTHPLARLFFGVAALYFLYEAATGACPLYARMGATKPSQRLSADRLYFLALLCIQLVLAYLWFHAGYEKVTGTFFADLPKTLAFFASKNPYPWYAAFLNGVAIPNAGLFGLAVMWGQLLVGAGLALGAAFMAYGDAQWRRCGLIVSVAALFAGACMNLHFWLAAGWTGPGTASSNVAMYWPQMVLAYVWIARLLEEKR